MQLGINKNTIYTRKTARSPRLDFAASLFESVTRMEQLWYNVLPAEKHSCIHLPVDLG